MDQSLPRNYYLFLERHHVQFRITNIVLRILLFICRCNESTTPHIRAKHIETDQQPFWRLCWFILYTMSFREDNTTVVNLKRDFESFMQSHNGVPSFNLDTSTNIVSRKTDSDDLPVHALLGKVCNLLNS